MEEFSPSFDDHRAWLEQLLTTPTPHPTRGSSRQDLLTCDISPSEHVLRGSKSFAARSFRSRASGNSLRVPSLKENRSTNEAENSLSQSCSEDALNPLPVLGEIQPNNAVLRQGPWRHGIRPSPTPSLKKKQAEAIVKAHGSPQHIRVTAGGRIVPCEQSPLCHPRYGYSAIKANGGLIKFAANPSMGPKQQWTQATQNGFVAQDVNGRLCQIVNGTILPLNEVDGALRLYMPAPNLNIDSSHGTSLGPATQDRYGVNGTQKREVSQGKPVASTEPSTAAQTNALELEYSKHEHELKELDKTEVLHGRTMGKTAKDALVSKRRELVVTMDNIRKAIKGLKTQPPPEVPTSPRGMHVSQTSTSPPAKSRLPPFLQHRRHDTTGQMQPAMGNFFVPTPHQQHGNFGFQQTPSSDAPFASNPFGMAPPGVFAQPPPFDGSMGQSFASLPGQTSTELSAQPRAIVASGEQAVDASIPQTDGAWSYAGFHKVLPGRGSHAISIKAPEPKSKSTLNPMSPAYKPGVGVLSGTAKSVKDRAPTPLSPFRQLRTPAANVVKNPNATEDTISPTKKAPHLHSSSISSFQTADFFPRNTREYSTRKDAYPDSASKSEDKENIDPTQQALEPITPNEYDLEYDASGSANVGSTPGFQAPTVPPSTPAGGQARAVDRSIDLAVIGVPDRQAHNLSPKAKRPDATVLEELSAPPADLGRASQAPENIQRAPEEVSVTVSPEKIDFTQASAAWIEGYRSGLARKTVGADRNGDFLDGYCAGLLKSQPTNSTASTGSPSKNTSRRPSPAGLLSRSTSRAPPEHRDPTPTRPPFETSLQSMDTLKEAMFAPHNEDAVLTPAAEGPQVNDSSFHLGAWSKHQGTVPSLEKLATAKGDGLAGFPFPSRTASVIKRQGIMSEGEACPPTSVQRHVETSTTQHSRSLAPSSVSMLGAPSSEGNRISSMTSIDSNLHRQYPPHRVLSPHLEWRSASSIAQAAGVASGHFTNTQFDGTNASTRGPAISSGPESQQRVFSTTSNVASITSNSAMGTHSRFREGSLDGLSDPTTSPQVMSPPMSPLLAGKDGLSPTKIKKNASPSKTGSPAKANFQNIAEKVGIKVSKDGSSPTSPPGKRRWRDVWRGTKKEDETA